MPAFISPADFQYQKQISNSTSREMDASRYDAAALPNPKRRCARRLFEPASPEQVQKFFDEQDALVSGSRALLTQCASSRSQIRLRVRFSLHQTHRQPILCLCWQNKQRRRAADCELDTLKLSAEFQSSRISPPAVNEKASFSFYVPALHETCMGRSSVSSMAVGTPNGRDTRSPEEGGRF